MISYYCYLFYEWLMILFAGIMTAFAFVLTPFKSSIIFSLFVALYLAKPSLTNPDSGYAYGVIYPENRIYLYIYYLVMVLLNLYYQFHPIFIMAECMYMAYSCYTVFYIEKLYTRIESIGQRSNPNYHTVYHHLEEFKINTVKDHRILLLYTIVIEIITHLSYRHLIHLVIMFGLKIGLAYHYLAHYYQIITEKQKKFIL